MDLLERMQKLKEQQESQKKESPQEEKKISKSQKIEITTPLEIEKEDNHSITIRKLMAVREMFNLKAPKKVTKKSLASLIIKALK